MLNEFYENDAKHSRLFELLRQTNQAEKTKARFDSDGTCIISANDMIQFQRAAFRSLQAQG